MNFGLRIADLGYGIQLWEPSPRRRLLHPGRGFGGQADGDPLPYCRTVRKIADVNWCGRYNRPSRGQPVRQSPCR